MVKYSENPILSPRPGEWDSEIYSPWVVYSNGIYHMWYGGAGTGPSRRPYGHITSTDEVNWINASTIIPLNSDTHAPALSVMYDDTDNVFKLWYQCWLDNTTDDYVRYAETTDGENYTNDQLVFRWNDGQGNSWDQSLDYGIYIGQVIKEGNNYKMWYTGRKSSGNDMIGYATSTDGLNWTKYSGNPVLKNGQAGEWDELAVHIVCVFYDVDHYIMIYAGKNSSGIWQQGLAYSDDGINWTKDPDNPLDIHGSSGSWDDNFNRLFTVIKEGNTYKIWYDANSIADSNTYQIGYATLN